MNKLTILTKGLHPPGRHLAPARPDTHSSESGVRGQGQVAAERRFRGSVGRPSLSGSGVSEADESGLMLRVMHVNVTGTQGPPAGALWDYLSQNICILPSENA